MATANSEDKDEQTRQERARAAIEAHRPKYDELSGGIRKEGRRLDVDEVLARSFKNVKSDNLALKQQSFEQGEAS